MAQAAEQDYWSTCQEVLDHDPELVDVRDAAGLTPLHKAASCGNLYAARVLILNGADISATTPCKKTALLLAVCISLKSLHFCPFSPHFFYAGPVFSLAHDSACVKHF